jgi:methylated-DNA-protein-cysteine methyltransferase related protein
MTSFKEQVIAIIKIIPRGKVASYGQIAAIAGSPQAARQVGQILRHYSNSEKLPWWRVINNVGHISIKENLYATAEMQKKLLERELVPVSEHFVIDIKKYRTLFNSAKIREIIK